MLYTLKIKLSIVIIMIVEIMVLYTTTIIIPKKNET